MLPGYILSVDIWADDFAVTEEAFRELVDPSLAHLDALQGSLRRTPCKRTYYPPGSRRDVFAWSVKGVVLVSLGKDRAIHLIELYKAIASLIEKELPDYDVQAVIDKVQI